MNVIEQSVKDAHAQVVDASALRKAENANVKILGEKKSAPEPKKKSAKNDK